MSRHDYIYDEDDPGPAPGSIPVCPICPAAADKPPDLIAVAAPPGYLCRHCGWWISPAGGRVDAKTRALWTEATRDGLAS